MLELCVLDGARVVRVDDLEEGIDEFALDRDAELGNQVSHFVNGEALAAVQIEIVEDLAEKVGVVASKLEHAGLHLSVKMPHGLLGDLSIFVLRHLPGGLHHAHEELVARGAH